MDGRENNIFGMANRRTDEIDKYKTVITRVVTRSKDIEYIRAVYTFATTYPDKSTRAGD